MKAIITKAVPHSMPISRTAEKDDGTPTEVKSFEFAAVSDGFYDHEYQVGDEIEISIVPSKQGKLL